jgi:DNA-directed RNA polymerase specialized sigma24 family protein
LRTPEQTDSNYENSKDEEQKLTVDNLNRLKRQKQTHLLDLQGFQNKEISEKLYVSLFTIEKDLSDIREESKEWFKKISKSGYLNL